MKTILKRKKYLGLIPVILILVVIISVTQLYSGASVEASGVVSIDIGIGDGFASSQFAADIKYPSDVDTDHEKLEAVYSLIEQMRLEHNRVGEIARSNWEEYQDEWAEYTRIFRTKQRELLKEQNRLRLAIRQSSYTNEEWSKLSEEERDIAYLSLYGDKGELKDLSTEATAGSLDQLKTVDFYSLEGQFVDPPEDWTTYTEVDPNGYLTVASNQVTITDMPRNQSTFLYDDKGAGHFGTTFTNPHLLSSEYGNIDNEAEIIIWGLTNETSFNLWTIDDGFFLIWEDWASQKPRFMSIDGGTPDYDDTYACSSTDTEYWFTIIRDDPSTCAIYSDSDRTNLLDTLSVSQVTDSFRYIISAASRGGSGSGASNAIVYNLDLQEGGGTPSITNSPSSATFDPVNPSNAYSTGLDYFTVTNNSGSAVNITISGTDITGGIGWALSDTGTPGVGTAGIKAGLDGGSYNIVVKKTAPFNTLKSNLAASASQDWGLQLLAPTNYTDSVQKAGTVTLTATVS